MKINYDNVELEADVIRLNNVQLLTSTSRHVHCRTANAVDNIKASTLETGLKSVVGIHDVVGFRLMLVIVDIQFNCVRD